MRTDVCGSSALGLLCALALACPPLVRGEEEAVRPFAVRSERRALSGSAQNRWLGVPAAREGSYEQSLELDFSGSIYHPNLMSYVLQTSLGVSEWEGQSVAKGVDYALSGSAHLATEWLREKPYSVSFHVDRRDDYESRSLFDRTRVAETAVGALARWSNGLLPLYLSIEQSWRRERRESGDRADDSLELQLGLESGSADQRIFTRGRYAFSDFDRSVAGLFENDGRSHEARLSNTLAFGSRTGSRLSSAASYLHLTGAAAQDSLSWSELLELALPFELAGQAYYGLNAARSPASASFTHQGRLQLRHQLYDSLTSTLAMHGALTSADTYRQSSLRPDLHLSYRKKITVGRLGLEYGLSPDFAERSSSSQSFTVLNETHVLDDAVISFLDSPHVEPGSISVTDQSGVLLYVEGVDYTVEVIGGRTQLRRVPGGGIANGALVLVDYRVMDNPSFRALTISQSAGLRFELFEDELSLHYRYGRRRHPHLDSQQPVSLESFDDHLAGVGLDLPPVRASLEYQYHGSSTLPYHALRAGQSLAQSFRGGSLLTLQGSEGFTLFAPLDLSQSFVEIVSRYDVPVGRELALWFAGGYRLQAETERSGRSLWSLDLGAQFHRGLLSGSAGYELRASVIDGVVSPDHSLSVSLRREF